MKLHHTAMIIILSGALSIVSITSGASTPPVDPRAAAYSNQIPQSPPVRHTSSTHHRHKKHTPKHRSHFFRWPS